MTTARKATGPVLLIIGWFAGLITVISTKSALPERVPIHWSGRYPDNYTGQSRLVVTVITAITLGCILGLTGLAVARHSDRTPLRRPVVNALCAVALVCGSGVLFASLGTYVTSYLAVRTDNASNAALPASFPLLLVAVVVLTLVPLASMAARKPIGDQDIRIAMPLSPGKRVTWTGTAVSMPMRWTSAVLALAAIGCALAGIWQPSPLVVSSVFVFIITAGAMFGLSSVSVTADRRGVQVSALGGLPLRRIPIERIESAQSVHIEPFEWGGWGLRISPRGYGVVVRRGPGIFVTTNRGRDFYVTVDDADLGSSVINGVIVQKKQ